MPLMFGLVIDLHECAENTCLRLKLLDLSSCISPGAGVQAAGAAVTIKTR